MIRLVFKSFCLLALVAVVTATTLGVLTMVPMGSMDFYMISRDKHARLAATARPRIILIGGSNLAFGIDSPRIERETGYATVNMGVHAGLGLLFMMREIRRSIGAGDIVVMVPEYTQLTSDLFYGSPLFLPALIAARTESLRDLDPRRQYGVFFSGLYTFVKIKLKRLGMLLLGRNEDERAIYNRGGFNAQGDLVAHLDRRSPGFRKPRDISGVVREDALMQINRFCVYARRSGARVFFSYPGFPESAFLENEFAIASLHARLRRQLAAVMLDTPHDQVYPDCRFFDTEYHLDRAGRDERTTRLIHDIKRILEVSPRAALR